MQRTLLILGVLAFAVAGATAQFSASNGVWLSPYPEPSRRDSQVNFHGYTIESGDRLGRSSAGIGDLDNDGIPDIAVCASRDSDGGVTKSGAVYILFMNKDLSVRSAQKISNDHGGFCTSGEGSPCLREQDRLGYSLAALGDVDGDGIVDIAVGADGDDDGYAFSNSANGAAGAVYVIFLNRDGTAKRKQKISNLAGGLAAALGGSNPLAEGSSFSQSVGAVGDTNGDGIPDLVVGAPGAGTKGLAYLLRLNADGTVQSGVVIDAPGALGSRAGFGGRAANLLGDLNGDQSPELIIGAYNEGKGAAAVLSLDWASGSVLSSTIIHAPAEVRSASAMFGHSIAALGDIDGDGVPDVAISANAEVLDDGDQDGEGTLFLMTLNADGSVKSSLQVDRDRPEGFPVLSAMPTNDRFCRSLSALGNVEGVPGGFTVLCGAGAHTGGSMYLLAFKGNGPCIATPAKCTSYPGAIYDSGTTAVCTGGARFTFEKVAGFKYCRSGTTLFSNWNHASQAVTGPLSLDACKLKATSFGDDGDLVMTAKEADGRCMVKSGCALTDSSEESTSYTIIQTDACDGSNSGDSTTAPPTSPATSTPSPSDGNDNDGSDSTGTDGSEFCSTLTRKGSCTADERCEWGKGKECVAAAGAPSTSAPPSSAPPQQDPWVPCGDEELVVEGTCGRMGNNCPSSSWCDVHPTDAGSACCADSSKDVPTADPTTPPTSKPSLRLTATPTSKPSLSPTAARTSSPTVRALLATAAPTGRPSKTPSPSSTRPPTLPPTRDFEDCAQGGELCTCYGWVRFGDGSQWMEKHFSWYGEFCIRERFDGDLAHSSEGDDYGTDAGKDKEYKCQCASADRDAATSKPSARSTPASGAPSLAPIEDPCSAARNKKVCRRESSNGCVWRKKEGEKKKTCWLLERTPEPTSAPTNTVDLADACAAMKRKKACRKAKQCVFLSKKTMKKRGAASRCIPAEVQ